MSDQEFFIVLVSIIFGCSVGIFLIGRITGLIKHWIDSRKKNALNAHQLESLESLERFKVNVEKRLQTLEAIAAEDRSFSDNTNQSVAGELGGPESETSEDTGKLKNMLRQRS